MNINSILEKTKVVLITYLIMILGYVIYCFFYNKGELSFISLFYFIILAGGGGLVPFTTYLLSYKLIIKNYLTRNTFIIYWLGGMIYAGLILIIFILFDIYTMGKDAFFKKEVFLGDYNLFIVFTPISLIIDWLMNFNIKDSYK